MSLHARRTAPQTRLDYSAKNGAPPVGPCAGRFAAIGVISVIPPVGIVVAPRLAMALRVMLVGSDSDVVAAVELSLSQPTDFEVVRTAGDEALVEAVAAAAPDVVIV